MLAIEIVVAVLILFRVFLPVIIRFIVNRKLGALPGARGHIDSVSLALWRGFCRLEGVTFEKTGRPAATVRCDSVEVDIAMPALLRGKLTIERLALEGGSARYSDHGARPRIDIGDARFTLKAGLTADLKALADPDRLAKEATGKVRLHVEGVRLVELNPLIQKSAAMRVRDGELSMVADVGVHRGRLHGWVEPSIHGLAFEREAGILSALKAGVANAGLWLVSSRDRVITTRVPVSGPIHEAQAGIWDAVVGLFKNAYSRQGEHIAPQH